MKSWLQMNIEDTVFSPLISLTFCPLLNHMCSCFRRILPGKKCSAFGGCVQACPRSKARSQRNLRSARSEPCFVCGLCWTLWSRGAELRFWNSVPAGHQGSLSQLLTEPCCCRDGCYNCTVLGTHLTASRIDHLILDRAAHPCEVWPWHSVQVTVRS